MEVTISGVEVTISGVQVTISGVEATICERYVLHKALALTVVNIMKVSTSCAIFLA